MKTKMYRQGDVLIERIAKTQLGSTVVLRENGRVVLAHGEVTGHCHAISEDHVTLYRDNQVTTMEIKQAMAMLTHDEHSTIEIPRGTYRVTRQREYSPESIRNVQD